MIKLFNEDCTEVMKDIPDNSIDLIVTSPPYYNAKNYSQWSTYKDYMSNMFDIFSEAVKTLKNQRYIIINVADILSGEKCGNRKPIAADFIKMMISLQCEYEDDVIWDKGEVQSKRGICAEHYPYYYKPINCYEHILIFRKNVLDKTKIPCPLCNNIIVASNGIANDGVQSWECKNPQCIRSSKNRGKRFSARTILMDSVKTTNNEISDEILDTFRRDVVQITPVMKINSKGDNIIGHPAPFPVIIPRFAIECYSGQNDIVLDMFMGSGTTGVAALKTNRSFIGIELDETYFNIAKERIENAKINT